MIHCLYTLLNDPHDKLVNTHYHTHLQFFSRDENFEDLVW